MLHFSDFTVSYLAKGEGGQNTYLSMLSDWDMDAAFQTASDPYLKLKVDLRPFDDGRHSYIYIITILSTFSNTNILYQQNFTSVWKSGLR